MSSKGGWRPAVPLALSRLPHSGRGFVAASHVPAGSLVVSIPMSLLITRDRAFHQMSVGGVMLGNSATSDIRTHDLLAAFLVRCKVVPGEEGLDWYRPYVESLPESYSVPFYCSEAEASSLPRYRRIS